LRAIRGHAYANCDSNSHSSRDRYSDCDTDVYAQSDANTKNSSDAEASTNSAAASLKALSPTDPAATPICGATPTSYTFMISASLCLR
jgi:hypothetical protein